MALTALAEEGPLAALTTPLVQLLSGSPLFFILQSRCIGAYFSGEFAVGGASYIPTGRGLAIAHQPFYKIFASFASSCLYPGAELALLQLLRPLVLPLPLPAVVWALAALMPVALLWGPAFFNPNVFKPRNAAGDLRGWGRWLLATGDDGWASYHRNVVRNKRGVAAHALLLPSKELLMACALGVVSYEAMRPFGWGLVHLCILGLPILPVALMVLLLALSKLRAAHCAGSRADSKASFVASPGAKPPPPKPAPSGLARLELGHAALAAACAGLLLFEAVVIAVRWPALPRSHVATLVGTRFFGWRFAFNALAYVSRDSVHGAKPKPPPPLRAAASSAGWKAGRRPTWQPPAQTAGAAARAALAACGWLSLEAARVTVLAHALLFDALLGVLLQLPVLALSLLLPRLSQLHFRLIFRTTAQRLSSSLEAQQLSLVELQKRPSSSSPSAARGLSLGRRKGGKTAPSDKSVFEVEFPTRARPAPGVGLSATAANSKERDEHSRRLTDDMDAPEMFSMEGSGIAETSGGPAASASASFGRTTTLRQRTKGLAAATLGGGGSGDGAIEAADRHGVAEVMRFFETMREKAPRPPLERLALPKGPGPKDGAKPSPTSASRRPSDVMRPSFAERSRRVSADI